MLRRMLGGMRGWWARRQQAKREKWAEDHAYISTAEMEKAQRGFQGRRQGMRQMRRRPGSRY